MQELESALLIVPPRPIQAFAYPLREAYDPESFARVPANLTLFYPFVPAQQVDEAVEKLTPIAARHLPLELRLDHYGRREDALTLEPADPAPLQALYSDLAEVYADYAGEFHAQLILARLRSPSQAEQIELPDEPSFDFRVEKLHIYVGSPVDLNAPYIPRATIPAG